MNCRRCLHVCITLLLIFSPWALKAQQQPPLKITVAYVTQRTEEPQPLFLVEPIATDKGVPGARLGLSDNNTTGRFLNQEYMLVESIVEQNGDLQGAARSALTNTSQLVIAD